VTSPLRLAIVTPIDGSPTTGQVHAAYDSAKCRLMSARGGIYEGFMSADIVRARNRAVGHVRTLDVSHVLWWDSDVAPEVEHVVPMVDAMLSLDVPLVGVGYPRKHDDGRIPLVEMGDRPRIGANQCRPVAAMGFGFMLTSRALLDQMWERYESELWYLDVLTSGKIQRLVGLFDLRYNTQAPHGWVGPWRERLSEDYSFCLRALEMGVQPMMYCGPGTPVKHIGGKAYEAG